MEALQATINQFGGVVIDPHELPSDVVLFRQQLEYSLAEWTLQGRNLVWLEMPIEKAVLIPVAVELGFAFHHTDPQLLTLTRQLIPNAYIPPYATHYIGAGGVVLNQRQELLVVVERYRGGYGRYLKLPGGALQQGEHLVDGVIREVFEETGVPTQFDGLVCFRHWHGYRHGKSDIYFVCRLSPLHEEINFDRSELDECMWLPVEQYLQHKQVSAFNRRIVEVALRSSGLQTLWIEGYNDPERREFFMPSTD
jgi:8-oxo-dGTP pyrophosphatase MutT (NUDIX family)